MESVAAGALVLLVIIGFNNWRQGKLGDWFGAKFLNTAAPAPASATTAAAGGTPGQVTTDFGGLQLGKSAFVLPVHGFTVTQLYGGPEPHPGIDLAVPTGTPVYAAAAGTITRASPFGGYGNCVDIDHGGGVSSRYGHLETILVHTGQTVQAGTIIGTADSTGNATGPHLHFEIRLNGQTTDPAPYLRIPERVGYKDGS